MSQLFAITQGWKDELPFTLKADGTPLNLTGLTVTILLKGNGKKTPITPGGTLTPDTNQTANPGKLTYKPAETDFKASLSPYTVRFKVVDGVGDIVYFPNGQADSIAVYLP